MEDKDWLKLNELERSNFKLIVFTTSKILTKPKFD